MRQGLTALDRNGKVTVWTACNAGHLQGVQGKGNTTLNICALHRWALTRVDALQHLPESRDGSEHQHRDKAATIHSSAMPSSASSFTLVPCGRFPLLTRAGCFLHSLQFVIHMSHAAVDEQLWAMTGAARLRAGPAGNAS